MILSDFSLEKAVFEASYPTKYLLWDRAGHIWTRLEQKWPDMKNEEANPARTVCRLDLSNPYHLTVEMKSATIVGYRPAENLKEFGEVVADHLRVVSEELRLQVFDRIGLKVVYFLQTPTLDDAEALLKDTKMVRLPAGSLFGIDTHKIGGDVFVRVVGEDIGSRVRITTQKKSVTSVPPPELDFKPMHQEQCGVIFDVEYYTVRKVDIAQVDFAEWIRLSHHVIRRDSEHFLRG